MARFGRADAPDTRAVKALASSAYNAAGRVRDEAAAALADLAPDELEWRAALILGIGKR